MQLSTFLPNYNALHSSCMASTIDTTVARINELRIESFPLQTRRSTMVGKFLALTRSRSVLIV